LPALDGEEPAHDGLAEIWFDDPETLKRALETPEFGAALADAENFCDTETMRSFLVEEVAVV